MSGGEPWWWDDGRPVALTAPERVLVDGIEYECLELWADEKEGMRRGGYVLKTMNGLWAIDYGNPGLGLSYPRAFNRKDTHLEFV